MGNRVYILKTEYRQEPWKILKAGKPEGRKDEAGKKSLFPRILRLIATGFPPFPFLYTQHPNALDSLLSLNT